MLAESYGPVVLKPQGSTWRSQKSEGGGALYDYAAHPLNLLNWYFGDVTRAAGTELGQIFSRQTDDEVYTNLWFASGTTAHLSVNWSDESQRKMTTKITVWGTHGTLVRRPSGGPALLARGGTHGPGLPAGLERPLHHRPHAAGRFLPAWRGVLRPARHLDRAHQDRSRSTVRTTSPPRPPPIRPSSRCCTATSPQVRPSRVPGHGGC